MIPVTFSSVTRRKAVAENGGCRGMVSDYPKYILFHGATYIFTRIASRMGYVPVDSRLIPFRVSSSEIAIALGCYRRSTFYSAYAFYSRV